MSILRKAAEGTGPISETFAVPAGETYHVIAMTLHLNAVPATNENFTLTLDAVDGPNYDALLYSIDLASAGVTNLLWQANVQPLPLVGGDALDVAWNNADGRTWGLLITMEAVF